MTSPSKPSGSYRLRVTVGYHDTESVSRSDKREATFAAETLERAFGDAEMWLYTYAKEYRSLWGGYTMRDIALSDQASDALLATLGGPESDDWVSIPRDLDGRSGRERAQIKDALITRSANMIETMKRCNDRIAIGRYADAASLLAWLPEEARTMQRDILQLIEG